MAKITYNGIELEEIVLDIPTFFNTDQEAIVWNDYANKDRVLVYSYDPRSDYPVRSNNDRIWKHFAFIPEKPAPRMATNRELARWLAQGNGEVLDSTHYINTYHEYFRCLDKDEVHKTIQVRKWDDTEWHTPDVEYMGITEVKTYEDVVKREG